jgi:hypothetical protein
MAIPFDENYLEFADHTDCKEMPRLWLLSVWSMHITNQHILFLKVGLDTSKFAIKLNASLWYDPNVL